MAKFIVGSDSNSVTNTGEAWIFRASDRPVGTLTQQLGGNGCSAVTWEIVDSAWSKVIASISNGAPGSSFQINSSGQVGMGTGSPMSTLDIYQAGLGTTGTGTALSLRAGNNSNLYGSNQIVFNYGGGAGSNSYAHAIKSRHQSGGPSSNGLDFFIWTNADNAATVGTKHVMTIDGTGGVGIGTCVPFAHNGNGLIVNGKGSDTRGIIELWDSGGSSGKSVLQQVGGDTYLGQLAKGTGAGNVHILTGGNGASATISMTLLCAGNIGVGTTAPDAKLHICNAVAGNTDNFLIIVQNCCTVSGARAGIAFSNNSQTPSAGGLSGASIQTSNNGIDGTGNLLFGTLLSGTNTERMRISHNGNIGISCTSPGSKLTVGGTLTTTDTITTTSGTVSNYLTYTSTTGVIGTQTNHSLQIRTNDTERLRVTCTGCIGVNITSPTYMLHVNGTFYSAGSSCEYKTEICQYNTDSCMFMKLTPVTYQYKDEYTHLGKELKSGTQIGLIAEDVAEVYPELAILKDEDDQKIVRNVDYEKLSIVLLSEVQKLRKELDELKTK